MATRRPATILAGSVKTLPAIDTIDSSYVPSVEGYQTGDVKWSARTSPDSGWLAMDGSLVSRSTYAALFAKISTTYGVGDGSTTFALPDIRGRSALGTGTGTGLTARTLGATGGEEAHSLSTTELPSHNHTITDAGHGHGYTGASHTHTFDISHNHTLTDPTHTHTYTGTGHVHALASGSGQLAEYIQGGTAFVWGSTVATITTYYSSCVSMNSGDYTLGATVTGANTAASANGYSLASTTLTASGGILGYASPTCTIASHTTGITSPTGSNGSGNSHNNMQPYLTLNAFIKT